MKFMKTIAALSLVASAAAASEPAETPFYARASQLYLQSDWADLNGGQKRGHGFEVGYTRPASEQDLITWGLYAGFVKSVGDYRVSEGVSFTTDALRFGADLNLKTPFEPLRAYAGFNIQYWSGNKVFPKGIKEPIPDTNAKFGLRLGVEYRITKHWGVSLDYNAAEWISDEEKTTYPVAGFNPVHPSWYALSVQYRFNAFRKK